MDRLSISPELVECGRERPLRRPSEALPPSKASEVPPPEFSESPYERLPIEDIMEDLNEIGVLDVAVVQLNNGDPTPETLREVHEKWTLWRYAGHYPPPGEEARIAPTNRRFGDLLDTMRTSSIPYRKRCVTQAAAFLVNHVTGDRGLRARAHDSELASARYFLNEILLEIAPLPSTTTVIATRASYLDECSGKRAPVVSLTFYDRTKGRGVTLFMGQGEVIDQGKPMQKAWRNLFTRTLDFAQ